MAGYQQTEMSPYERMIYQDDPMVMSALGNYANYRGSALPSSKIAMPNLPSGNISLGALPSAKSNINTKAYYVDPNSSAYTMSTEKLRNEANKVQNFQIDPNDPVYRWKQEEAKKAALSALASKGLSGSKYGMSTLGNAYMNVMANESEQQLTYMGVPLNSKTYNINATMQKKVILIAAVSKIQWLNIRLHQIIIIDLFRVQWLNIR
jgi:hypothetical protein